MKKALLIVAATLFFGYANAQMKLGSNPTITNENALLEMETTSKGLLLPRVALTSTTSFAPLTAHVAGMAVYNTATVGDVTPGYYFDNGTTWVKLSDASALQLTTGAAAGKVLTSDAVGNATWQTPAAGANIYNVDGSLAGNRIVTQGVNTLAFTGTAVNAFSVDGTTLSVDAANRRVGIGTAAPASELHVMGEGLFEGTTFASAKLKANATGRAQFSLEGNGQIARYGITTASQQYLSPTVAGDIALTGGSQALIIGGDNALNTGAYLKLDFTNKLFNVINSKLGVGTSTPATTLDVNGTTKTTNLQVTTGAGVGKVLLSDASGNAAWTAVKDVAGFVTTLIVSPNSGAPSGNIPCTAGYDIIRYVSADGNHAGNITLPTGCKNGQRIQISSESSLNATISKTNTNAIGTTICKSGDYYEYIFNNGKWSTSFVPTKRAAYCTTNSIPAPTTPLSIVDFSDGCWGSPVTMPIGSVGDEYIIWDIATFNVTINPLGGQPNITLVTGNFVKLVYTTGGWVKVF